MRTLLEILLAECLAIASCGQVRRDAVRQVDQAPPARDEECVAFVRRQAEATVLALSELLRWWRKAPGARRLNR